MVFFILHLSRIVPRSYRMRRKAHVISRKFKPISDAITGQILLSFSDPVKQKQSHQKNRLFTVWDNFFDL